jgi:hypothetical protein
MVGGDFLSRPRPCMVCSAWECVSEFIKFASVTGGLSKYVQEPLAIGRRGCTGRDLNEKTLATDRGR